MLQRSIRFAGVQSNFQRRTQGSGREGDRAYRLPPHALAFAHAHLVIALVDGKGEAPQRVLARSTASSALEQIDQLGHGTCLSHVLTRRGILLDQSPQQRRRIRSRLAIPCAEDRHQQRRDIALVVVVGEAERGQCKRGMALSQGRPTRKLRHRRLDATLGRDRAFILRMTLGEHPNRAH